MAITRSRNTVAPKSGGGVSKRQAVVRDEKVVKEAVTTKTKLRSKSKGKPIVKKEEKSARNDSVEKEPVKEEVVHEKEKENVKENNEEKEKEKVKVKVKAKAKSRDTETGETKGRRMPAYKIEQLQRLQRLIDLSSAAKPKGPITKKDTEDGFSVASRVLKLRLSEDNKRKISGITNYDPLREQFLEGTLDEDILKALKERYEKIRNLKDIRVLNLENDEYLQMALKDISNEIMGLDFWKPSKILRKVKEAKVGCGEMLENEMKLNRLALQEEVRDNLLEQKLKHTIDFHDRAFGDAGEEERYVEQEEEDDDDDESGGVYRGLNYERIDKAHAAAATDLGNMLSLMDSSGMERDERSLFDGLKVEDYTSRRNFRNSRA